MIDVVGALITNDRDEILIARRKEGKHLAGCWEFPGGKIEKGETPEDCLKRELKEEMNLDIEVLDYYDGNEHEYEDFTINLMIYSARIIGGEMKLMDHDRVEWVKRSEMRKYGFTPADVVIVERIVNQLRIEN